MNQVYVLVVAIVAIVAIFIMVTGTGIGKLDEDIVGTAFRSVEKEELIVMEVFGRVVKYDPSKSKFGEMMTKQNEEDSFPKPIDDSFR